MLQATIKWLRFIRLNIRCISVVSIDIGNEVVLLRCKTDCTESIVITYPNVA